MPSLQEILAQHPSALVLDSASTVVQVGLLRRGSLPDWEALADEAGTAIFTATEALLHRASWKLDQVDAFIFCDGPGSVLGIRTAAVALRIWSMLRPRPIFALGSLDLVARFQLHCGTPGPFSVIADARRETWHVLAVGADGKPSALRRGKLETIAGALLTPENFRNWSPLPGTVLRVPYAVRTMLAALEEAPLFRVSTEPDAFLHEEPAYQGWTPQVHRAPS